MVTFFNHTYSTEGKCPALQSDVKCKVPTDPSGSELGPKHDYLCFILNRDAVLLLSLQNSFASNVQAIGQ